jgi:hypothetical protein
VFETPFCRTAVVAPLERDSYTRGRQGDTSTVNRDFCVVFTERGLVREVRVLGRDYEVELSADMSV